jgi:chromosome segregation ATPase
MTDQDQVQADAPDRWSRLVEERDALRAQVERLLQSENERVHALRAEAEQLTAELERLRDAFIDATSHESIQKRDGRIATLEAENAKLKAAILDIDAHATPLGTDADGFVSTGYVISVGCLHRALGLIGYAALEARIELENRK